MASRNPPESDTNPQQTLLEFPCKFPIKAMGRSEDGFEALVTEIILTHAELHAGELVTTNASGSGNFISVTVTIMALSKAQLDRIYQDLTDCEHVLVAL
jgi:putative lipoic acid-binding regulatory protein